MSETQYASAAEVAELFGVAATSVRWSVFKKREFRGIVPEVRGDGTFKFPLDAVLERAADQWRDNREKERRFVYMAEKLTGETVTL